MPSGGEQSGRSRVIGEMLRRHKESAVVEEWQPEFIGEGGENAVFVVPGMVEDERIVKVNRRSVVDALRLNLERGRPLNYITDDERREVRRRREGAYDALARMRKYFGDAVLSERVTIRQIPVSNEILDVVMPGKSPKLPEGTYETLAMVSLQKKAPDAAFVQGSSFNFHNRYIEKPSKKNPVSPEQYEAINRACIDNPDLTECGRMLQFLTRDMSLFEQAEKDKKLHRALGEFIKRAMRFSEETGDMLDCIGDDNIRFYLENGEWKQVIIDGRTTPGNYTMLKGAMDKLARNQSLEPRELSAMLNGLAYVRFLNAAAAHLGIAERLKVSTARIARMSPKLLDTLRTHLTKS